MFLFRFVACMYICRVDFLVVNSSLSLSLHFFSLALHHSIWLNLTSLVTSKRTTRHTAGRIRKIEYMFTYCSMSIKNYSISHIRNICRTWALIHFMDLMAYGDTHICIHTFVMLKQYRAYLNALNQIASVCSGSRLSQTQYCNKFVHAVCVYVCVMCKLLIVGLRKCWNM